MQEGTCYAMAESTYYISIYFQNYQMQISMHVCMLCRYESDIILLKPMLMLAQRQCSRISVSPFDFSLNLQAMTIEKLQFSLPAVFTIGPDNNLEALKKYALLLSGNADGTPSGKKITPTKQNHVQDIVKGIIEGETRVIVSSMTMEEIFKERQIFKTKGLSMWQRQGNRPSSLTLII